VSEPTVGRLATLVFCDDSWRFATLPVKMSEHRTLAVRMPDAMAMRVAAPMLDAAIVSPDLYFWAS